MRLVLAVAGWPRIELIRAAGLCLRVLDSRRVAEPGWHACLNVVGALVAAARTPEAEGAVTASYHPEAADPLGKWLAAVHKAALAGQQAAVAALAADLLRQRRAPAAEED